MATLYVEQKSLIEGVVRRSGVAERDVADVTHDAFLQIASALDRFDPKRSRRAWFATIARRTARDHLVVGHLLKTTHSAICNGVVTFREAGARSVGTWPTASYGDPWS